MTRLHPLPVALMLGSLTVICWQSGSIMLAAMACLLLVVLGAVVAGPRAPIATLGLMAGLGLLLWWTLVTLVFGQPGATGPVLVVVPSHSVGPSVELGGPVHQSTALAHLGRLLRGWMLLLAPLLMLQLVAAKRWLDLASLVLGRAALLMAPMLCWPEALATSMRDRGHLARHGLAPTWRNVFTDAAEGAAEQAEAWQAMRAHHPPSPAARLLSVLMPLALGPVLAFDAVHAQGLTHADHVRKAVLALLGVVLLARLVRPGRAWLGRLRAADMALFAAAGGMVAAWMLRERTGDRDALVSTSVWTIPPVLSFAVLLACLVLAAAATPRRRRRPRPARPKARETVKSSAVTYPEPVAEGQGR